ncbi:MAG: hypothetical protein O7198_03245 [Wolbachia endosymbiont of Nomada marshamella]|nr:hypothetical protein [Wolbachia endosymbiont of Nomada marshamella]
MLEDKSLSQFSSLLSYPSSKLEDLDNFLSSSGGTLEGLDNSIFFRGALSGSLEMSPVRV